MFYQGGEIPPYVNCIGISWLRTITHTQEPMTLVMDSWHTSIQNGFGNSVDLRKSYSGRFLNGFLKRVFYGIQRVARGDCSF